jgi:hypothetical protein
MPEELNTACARWEESRKLAAPETLHAEAVTTCARGLQPASCIADGGRAAQYEVLFSAAIEHLKKQALAQAASRAHRQEIKPAIPSIRGVIRARILLSFSIHLSLKCPSQTAIR